MVGEPTLKLSYSGTAVAAPTHVYAQILDSTGRVVGNQATPIPVTLDGVLRTIERPLEVIASEAKAGAGYKLQITPATTLYTPQRSAGAVTFARIEISPADHRLRLRTGQVAGLPGRGIPGRPARS